MGRVRELEDECTALTARLAKQDAELSALHDASSRLAAELQESSAQLDNERLKSMALERALKRFVEMGGVIPKRTEG